MKPALPPASSLRLGAWELALCWALVVCNQVMVTHDIIPGRREDGVQGRLQGLLWEETARIWQRQFPPSSPRPAGSYAPVLTLGCGRWVIAAGISCFFQELSCPWASLGTLLVGSR